MEVSINGQPASVEIGPGESLGQVLARADELLEQSGSVIVGIAVDGRPVDGDSYASVRDLPAAEVGRVELSVESAAAYRGKAFTLFLDLLEEARALAAAPQAERAAWEALGARNHEFGTSLAGLFAADELSYVLDFQGLLERVAAEAGQGGLSERLRGELIARIQALSTLFGERLEELGDPAEEFRRTAALFAREVEELKDISVHLQTGKEDRAMKSVLLFIEIFNKVIRLMPELDRAGLDTAAIRVEGQELPSFYASINDVLRELSKAFEDKDAVLIGDLAEYEVVPRMTGFFVAVEEALAQS